MEDLSEPDADDAHRWPLAWRQLDVRHLGRLSWRLARALSAIRARLGHTPGDGSKVRYVPRRDARMGVFPCERPAHGGRVVLPHVFPQHWGVAGAARGTR